MKTNWSILDQVLNCTWMMMFVYNNLQFIPSGRKNVWSMCAQFVSWGHDTVQLSWSPHSCNAAFERPYFAIDFQSVDLALILKATRMNRLENRIVIIVLWRARASFTVTFLYPVKIYYLKSIKLIGWHSLSRPQSGVCHPGGDKGPISPLWRILPKDRKVQRWTKRNGRDSPSAKP